MQTKLVGIAVWLAAQYHVNQVDKSGQSYILHPLSVMEGVREHLILYPNALPNGYTIDEMLAGAVLHDTVEDTHLSLTLIQTILGEKVAELVDGVTRRSNETYVEFIKRAKSNPASKIIKMIDVMDNLRRLKNLSTEEQKSLQKRYGKALEILYAN